jgi:hypothetical protein
VAAALDAALFGGSAHAVAAGTPAVIAAVFPEPYAITPGQTLLGNVNGHPFAVTFHATDFDVPALGTAAEVATRIMADVPDLIAYDNGTGRTEAATRLWGAGASFEVTGGTAAPAFGPVPPGPQYGTDAARVEIQSDLWDEDAEVQVVGGAANAILDYRLDPVGGSGAAILGPSSSYIRFSFDLETVGVLSPEQEVLVRRIANYMKPAHTHLLNVRPAPVPPGPDAWTLGLSELGEDSDLAEA